MLYCRWRFRHRLSWRACAARVLQEGRWPSHTHRTPGTGNRPGPFVRVTPRPASLAPRPATRAGNETSHWTPPPVRAHRSQGLSAHWLLGRRHSATRCWKPAQSLEPLSVFNPPSAAYTGQRAFPIASCGAIGKARMVFHSGHGSSVASRFRIGKQRRGFVFESLGVCSRHRHPPVFPTRWGNDPVRARALRLSQGVARWTTTTARKGQRARMTLAR